MIHYIIGSGATDNVTLKSYQLTTKWLLNIEYTAMYCSTAVASLLNIQPTCQMGIFLRIYTLCGLEAPTLLIYN